MTIVQLTGYALPAVQAGAWLIAGTLVGAFHFWALQRNVGILAAGRGWLAPVAILFARFALLAGLLAAVAMQFGGLPLLLVAGGIRVARTAVLRGGALS